jgi:beta-glucosidase
MTYYAWAAVPESILKNIKNGTLSQGDVATNLSRILELVLKSPAMNNYKYSNKPNLKENAQITRQAAAEGTILLKTTITLPYTSKKRHLLFWCNLL